MMDSVRTIAYDDKTYGRKVLTFPPDMPFLDHINELLSAAPIGEARTNLLKIGAIENTFQQVEALGEYLATSSEPHREILRIAALAAEGEGVGLKLLYAALVALPPAETMVTELIEFKNVNRIMAEIARKERGGTALKESEDWFKKKVLLLSMSHALPGGSGATADAPWLGWSDGVRRAIADPDRRWDKAIMERAKVELEALELRVKGALATINFMTKPRSTIYLISKAEETKWLVQALEGAYQRYGETTLLLRQKLGERWDPAVAALRATPGGSALADLFEKQHARAHPYPHMKLGTAIIRGLLMHPLLLRIRRKPDYLSCLAVFVDHAGQGMFEILLHKLAAVNIIKVLLDLPGFELHHKVLTIDVRRVPAAHFVDIDQLPRDVDWANIHQDQAVSYRTLVMTYIDNDQFIMELLNNPRVLAQPGIIALVSLRSRSMRVLTIVANRRDLYTGFANKEVPLNLLLNPSKVPVSAIRKFIHVRFIDKTTLIRLGGKGSQIRDEVKREIQRYLGSLN
jgi:hypothetical protein